MLYLDSGKRNGIISDESGLLLIEKIIQKFGINTK